MAEDLVEKARSEYGIVNADQMSESQLKSEMKTIDDQAKEPKEAAPRRSSSSNRRSGSKPASSNRSRTQNK